MGMVVNLPIIGVEHLHALNPLYKLHLATSHGRFETGLDFSIFFGGFTGIFHLKT
jgi:hypothetical protein